MHTDHNHKTDFLDSVTQIQRAAAPDFFQTRLMARLKKEILPEQSSVWKMTLKPLPALAFLTCLVVLNLYTLSNFLVPQEKSVEQQEATITGFANEYDLYNTVDVNN